MGESKQQRGANYNCFRVGQEWLSFQTMTVETPGSECHETFQSTLVGWARLTQTGAGGTFSEGITAVP